MFPDTPQTLLRKIAQLADGDDQAEWEQFVELYSQPLRNFIHLTSEQLSDADVEDAVQEIFIRLVAVLREERIDRGKGKFRAYLATLTRRLLIDRYRAELVRPQVATDDQVADTVSPQCSLADVDPGTLLDVKWRLAVRQAAERQVLMKSALSAQSRAIYEALRTFTPQQVAERFGVTPEVVRQVKSRIDRAIAAFCSRLPREGAVGRL